MTEKMNMFVREYLKDFNATQAAVRAGYSKKTAKAIGCENLTKPDIQEAIEEAKKDIVENKDRIVLENICFWESVRRNPKSSESNRLKASEYLGRYSAMFTDKIDANIHGKIGLDVSSLSDEELDEKLKSYDKD